jgi:tight adherence protein C
MQLYLVLGLIFIAATLTSLLVLWLMGRKSERVMKRLRNVENISGERDLRQHMVGNNAFGKKETKPNIEKLIKTLSQLASRDKSYNSKLRLSLMQGGYYQENSMRIFLSLRILSAMVLLFFSIGLGLLSGQSALFVLLVGLLMPPLGYLLPGTVLKSKIRRRQDEIGRGLPDALDFLVVCVEAGMGLNSAIIRVGQEFQLRCRALGEELLMVNQEMRTGMSREQALRHLSQRNRVEDLKILVGSLVLSDKLGTNVTDTLRAQSDSLRTRVRQRAEEKAAKAGIKMLFPLIFLILPALFIVILGPGLIMLQNTLITIAQ